MIKTVSLKDLSVDVISGQIMSRISVKEDSTDNVIETRKVIVPKAISSDGTVDCKELSEEKIKVKIDSKKLTKVGDIVIKLSTPYDAAIIDEESANCIIPSFCALIRHKENLDTNYLLAFLNSNYCKEQLKQQVAGVAMTVLSVGKVSSVLIPYPSLQEQREIGESYIKAQNKLKIMRQIVELEAKRNDLIFKEMVK